MKICLLNVLFLLCFIPCIAQIILPGGNGQSVSTASHQLLTEPATFEIETSNELVTFSNAADYSGSKTIHAYYRIHVSGQKVPWMVTVKVSGQSAVNGNSQAPENFTSLASLRDARTGHTIRLSGTPQVLLRGNNPLDNDYFIDLIIDPPYDYSAGVFYGSVDFQLVQE